MRDIESAERFEVMYNHQKYRDEHRNDVVRVNQTNLVIGKRALQYADNLYKSDEVLEHCKGLVALASRNHEAAHMRMAATIIHAARHYEKNKEVIQDEALTDAYLEIHTDEQIEGWNLPKLEV